MRNISSIRKVRLLVNRRKVHDTCIIFVILYAVDAWGLLKKLYHVPIKCNNSLFRYITGITLKDNSYTSKVLKRC